MNTQSTDADSMISAAVTDETSVIEDQSIEDLIVEYRDRRDQLADARHTYQKFEQETKSRLDEIAMKLREIAEALGLNALPTPAGTAYRTIKETYRVGNWDEVLEYIQATGNWQMLEKRIAKLATKEIFESTGVMPPGVEYMAEVEFVIRKN